LLQQKTVVERSDHHFLLPSFFNVQSCKQDQEALAVAVVELDHLDLGRTASGLYNLKAHHARVVVPLF